MQLQGCLGFAISYTVSQMACHVLDTGRHPQHHQQSDSNFEPAFREAQNWIEAVTGRRFGDKDFRAGLENGILLCELLSSVKPGLVKKINRLPTPIAGLDNLTLFLRGCEELGLKGAQLFDPGDLLDCPVYPNNKGSDCSRKLKNVLITIYWLGRAANSCTSYNGPTLDLREFNGLLSQMRKEAEDAESPKRSVRDSGYIDCWDSERSDSLSPPRGPGRDDSFDSLDSFGSRSQRTPSPDALCRGSSDGRGSDSESDAPQRKLPDVRRDDMLTRRTSVTEPRTAAPFNQYLPNRSNQSGYVPGIQRRRSQEPEDGHRSWSTATSPVGGERPFRYSHRYSVSDDSESASMTDMRGEEEVFLQHHTQAHHQLMHSQYQQLREEENVWQADLARWKSRRRSIAQDLIKKEEERKMMERLMTGDSSISQRRKSIKTYKEIVEDKQRREKELHDAYQKARSPEEAAAVLQLYASRFTLSEAVLTQLNLPRHLERSVSAQPTATPQDANPMKYLRQQSLPAPRFTSTVEAMVAGFTSTHAGGKVHEGSDVKERLNVGENGGSQEGPPIQFLPSLDAPIVFKSTAQVPPSESMKAGSDLEEEDSALQSCCPVSTPTAAVPEEATPSRPTFLPAELQGVREEHAHPSSPLQGSAAGKDAATHSPHTDYQLVQEASGSRASAMTTDRERVSIASALQRPSACHQDDATVSSITEVEISVPKSAHTAAGLSLSSPRQRRIEPVRTSPPSGPRLSDSAETVGTNEKYRHQQEKLRREWERAQQEVQEEERRYQEEERRILEETVAPLAPRVSPHDGPTLPIVRSLADWERKQELLGRHTVTERGNKPTENKCNSAAEQEVATEISMKATESGWVHSSSQVTGITYAQQNGQKQPGGLEQVGTLEGASCHMKVSPEGTRGRHRGSQGEGMRQKTGSLDQSWNSQQTPSGNMKRTGSFQHVGTNSSKSPSSSCSSSSSSDAQPPSPIRSVSGKKLCSSCGHPLGKGAAMIIETLNLYFHINCFKCGVCKGQLGDTSAGTDVRIRNGLLNCHQCYIKSRVAGQPTTL